MSSPVVLTLPSGVIVQYRFPSPLESVRARAAWLRVGGENSGASVFHAYFAYGVQKIGSQSFDLERTDLFEPLAYMPSEQDMAVMIAIIQYFVSTTQEQVNKTFDTLQAIPNEVLTETNGHVDLTSENGEVVVESAAA